MFRSVTSKVSTVSGFVAEGHQAMHHVSCSPSEIPYVGFSPVRLQTGIGRRPSRSDAYTPPKPVSRRPIATLGISAVSSYTGNPVQRPLARQRVMLSRRVIAYYGLIRASGPHPSGLFSSSRGPFRGPEGPHFTLRVCSSVPPSVPRWTRRLQLTVASPPALAFAVFASARHPHCRAIRFARGRCNEAAKFASCCGPEDCSPFTGKDFYARAFTSQVALKRRRV
jgi:hypothetical protein